VNQTVPPTLTNELAMQSLVYYNVREMFGLSAQLAIHAIRRVSRNRKTAKKDGKPVKNFAPTSVTYDPRIFSFRVLFYSITMRNFRQIKISIGWYFRPPRFIKINAWTD